MFSLTAIGCQTQSNGRVGDLPYVVVNGVPETTETM